MLTEANEGLVSFLLPKEAIIRLDEIIGQFKAKIAGNSSVNLLASHIFCLALEAQKKILDHLNDDNFYCQVPWDLRTGLPSHPSLAADAVKYSELFEVSSQLKALLNSFSGWSLFTKETKKCHCMVKGKTIEVGINIFVNTLLKADSDGLKIKLLFGVKSDVDGYIEQHWHLKKSEYESKVADDLYIIFSCENVISFAGENLALQPVSFHCVELLFSISDLQHVVKSQIITEL